MTADPIELQARGLARVNRAADPGIRRVLWFPHDHEVRLVEVTDEVPASDGRALPFYFRASVADGLPAPSGVVLLRSEEVGQVELPEGWGDWADARELDEASP